MPCQICCRQTSALSVKGEERNPTLLSRGKKSALIVSNHLVSGESRVTCEFNNKKNTSSCYLQRRERKLSLASHVLNLHHPCGGGDDDDVDDDADDDSSRVVSTNMLRYRIPIISFLPAPFSSCPCRLFALLLLFLLLLDNVLRIKL